VSEAALGGAPSGHLRPLHRTGRKHSPCRRCTDESSFMSRVMQALAIRVMQALAHTSVHLTDLPCLTRQHGRMQKKAASTAEMPAEAA